MRQLTFFLLALAVAGHAGATAQAPDVLKMNGKTYYIHSNPLGPVLDANPGRLPEGEVISSDLWRGYIATWAVRENRLFLDDVGIPTEYYADSNAPESKQFKSAMKTLFGDARPRLATWYTGHLIIPTGKLVHYVHEGYTTTYSSYIVLTVIKGAVQKQRNFNAEQFAAFRRAQFEAYKKTSEYVIARADARNANEPMSEERIEKLLFEFATEEYLSRIFD